MCYNIGFGAYSDDYGFEDFDFFPDNFRPDAVSGNHSDFVRVHAVSSLCL